MNEPNTGVLSRPTARPATARHVSTTLRHGRRTVAVIGVSAVVLVAVIVGGYLVTRSPADVAITFYSRGEARLATGTVSESMSLDKSGATLVSSIGADLTWKNADGWSLNVNGPIGADLRALAPAASVPPVAPGAAVAQANGSLELDGNGYSRWAGFDSRTCVIVYSEVTTIKIAGTVRCRGLQWYDGSSAEHVKPLDVAPFDLDVEFQASGPGTLPPTSAPS